MPLQLRTTTLRLHFRYFQSQGDWEKKFKDPSPKIEGDSMQRPAARPHHVGSPQDKDNAEWILDRFKAWGLDAHIEQYDVLHAEAASSNYRADPFVAKLQEPVVSGDPTSNQQSEQLPPTTPTRSMATSRPLSM